MHSRFSTTCPSPSKSNGRKETSHNIGAHITKARISARDEILVSLVKEAIPGCDKNHRNGLSSGQSSSVSAKRPADEQSQNTKGNSMFYFILSRKQIRGRQGFF